MEDKFLARKHFNKAFDYYFKGSRKAIKEARAAIAHQPKWSRPHWLLGLVFMFVPPIDLESAIREYREVTRKEPQWSIGHHDLGRALAKQGRIDEAMVAFRESLRLEPDSIWTRIWLAQCLLKRGDYREAITVLRSKPSLSHYYTVADAHLLLAEAMAQNNGRDEARGEWEFILTLDDAIPAYRVAKVEARRRLLETEKP